MRPKHFLDERIRPLLGELLATLRHAPVELFLALFSAFYGCLLVTGLVDDEAGWMVIAPIFVLAYLLNRALPRGKWRLLYYLTPLLLALLAADVEAWSDRPWFITLLALCPVILLLSRCRRSNEGFVIDGLHGLKNLALAYLLAWVAFGLSWAICGSVVYIFDLPDDPLDEIVGCLASLFFVGVMPALWLTFDRTQRDDCRSVPFFDTLAGWVVTPALLIYAAVLYLYFLKIVVTWELPRGGVAWMVFGFVALAAMVRAYRSVGGVRVAGWFYERFHWICLPALLMFWIGVGRRIADYGLTEMRIYLVVCGLVMSFTALMFFWRRVASYRYALAGGALLFALLAVPGITAGELAERWGREEELRIERVQITLNSYERVQGIDLSDYAVLHTPSHPYYESEVEQVGYGYMTPGDSLMLYAPDGTLLLHLSFDELLARQVARTGLPIDSLLTREALEAHRDELLVYSDERLALLFGSISFRVDTTLVLDDLYVDQLLLKRKTTE